MGGGYTVLRHDVSERSQALPKGRLCMGGENTTHVLQEIQHDSSGRMRCIHPILFEKAIGSSTASAATAGRSVRPHPTELVAH